MLNKKAIIWYDGKCTTLAMHIFSRKTKADLRKKYSKKYSKIGDYFESRIIWKVTK